MEIYIIKYTYLSCAYSLMNLYIWKHHLNQELEHFYPLLEDVLVSCPSKNEPSPTSKHYTDFCHSRWDLPVLELHINGISCLCCFLSKTEFLRFIRVVLWISRLPPTQVLCSIPLYDLITICLFILMMMSCFQYLTMLNKPSMKILVQVFLWTHVLVLPGNIPGGGSD